MDRALFRPRSARPDGPVRSSAAHARSSSPMRRSLMLPCCAIPRASRSPGGRGVGRAGALQKFFRKNTGDLQWKMHANYNAKLCAGSRKSASARTMENNARSNRTVGKSGRVLASLEENIRKKNRRITGRRGAEIQERSLKRQANWRGTRTGEKYSRTGITPHRTSIKK